MKKQEYLVIHCTATPEGRHVTSETIRHWHTDPKPKGRGWKQVGYRRIFHLNGGVEEMVKNNCNGIVETFEITNGAAGYNSVSEHWVYVGGLDKNLKAKDTRTVEQRKSLEREVLAFHKKFPGVKIVGHHYLDKGKACPSFDVQQWLKQLGINQIL